MTSRDTKHLNPNNRISHLLIAHRGYPRRYPENSLAGFEAALKAGALHIELDVQISADHQAVMYHDDNLQRGSGIDGSVLELTLEQLQALPYHEPKRFKQKFGHINITPLQALAPLAKQYPQATFYVELKEESLQHFGSQLCLQTIAIAIKPFLQQCCLISFDLAALQDAHHYGFNRLGFITRNWTQRNQDIANIKAEILFINQKRLPRKGELTAACPIAVYEIPNLTKAEALLARGVSLIETFAFLDILAECTAVEPSC